MLSSIHKVASRYLLARSLPPVSDINDAHMAIMQILMRSGWEQGYGGKVIKKVKAPFQHAPKIFTLETLRDGDMLVKDPGGRVLSKVDLKTPISYDGIMNAARVLNSGPQKVMKVALTSKD